MELEYCYKDNDFTYEITEDDLIEFLNTKTKSELIDLLIESFDFEVFADELRDFFESDAIEYFEKEKDPFGYVGISQKDFL